MLKDHVLSAGLLNGLQTTNGSVKFANNKDYRHSRLEMKEGLGVKGTVLSVAGNLTHS